MRATHKLLLAVGLMIATLPLTIPNAHTTIDFGVMAPRGPLRLE